MHSVPLSSSSIPWQWRLFSLEPFPARFARRMLGLNRSGKQQAGLAACSGMDVARWLQSSTFALATGCSVFVDLSKI